MKIAIDGPAGSGKTTVSKLLAKILNFSYLDTGAIYRSLTLKVLKEKIELTDNKALAHLAKALDLHIKGDKVYLDGVDVSGEIRAPLIDKNISVVVSVPEVRAEMVNLQRKIARDGDFVIEGRDITTVVFPESEFKFYLDADPKIRATRRFKELQVKGLKVAFEEVNNDLSKRDEADKTRKVSPLKVSEDAVYVDTTNLSIEETVEEILTYVKNNR